MSDKSSLIETRDWVHFRRLPALQQPDWPDRDELHSVLRSLPHDDLVTRDSVDELRIALAGLESGGLVLQLGDCVEDIDGDVGAVTHQKLGFLNEARARLRHRTGREVIAVGRLAGQYAKPRSSDHEIVDGVVLPSFRGPIVNSPHASLDARIPSAQRVAQAHDAARRAYDVIEAYNRTAGHHASIWTSHELLLLDYELRFLRNDAPGNHLSTTHWPWIGERTRQRDGAHIALASTLSNPVSVKLGPSTSPDEAVRLAQRLNPHDEPGRLTFIVRMGHQYIDRLQPVVRGVHRRIGQVNWISDPMHGNTTTSRSGFKTRHVEHVVAELRRFQEILLDERRHPAGLHLEATPDDVYECSRDHREPVDPSRYRTLLDPRLNPEQTAHVLDQWFA